MVTVVAGEPSSPVHLAVKAASWAWSASERRQHGRLLRRANHAALSAATAHQPSMAVDISMAPCRLLATGQPSAWVASTRSNFSRSSSAIVNPAYVTWMRLMTSTLPSSSTSPRAFPTRPAGSIRRTARAPANVPVSQPAAAPMTWSIVVARGAYCSGSTP